ncbi:hypothetical protein [Halalkalibacter akibai]|nr:hypothetical protein [Halalkalibacter akibai]
MGVILHRFLTFVMFVFILFGCEDVSVEKDSQARGDFDVTSVFSQDNPFLSFSWIEKGYSGIFAPIDTELGIGEMGIRNLLGQPTKEGYYEGGRFLDYSDRTFFINPETNKSVAMAIDVKSYHLKKDDLKRTLGTPDESEFNEMDGLWMFVYKLEDYELMFEAETEDGILSHAWLRNKRQ